MWWLLLPFVALSITVSEIGRRDILLRTLPEVSRLTLTSGAAVVGTAKGRVAHLDTNGAVLWRSPADPEMSVDTLAFSKPFVTAVLTSDHHYRIETYDERGLTVWSSGKKPLENGKPIVTAVETGEFLLVTQKPDRSVTRLLRPAAGLLDRVPAFAALDTARIRALQVRGSSVVAVTSQGVLRGKLTEPSAALTPFQLDFESIENVSFVDDGVVLRYPTQLSFELTECSGVIKSHSAAVEVTSLRPDTLVLLETTMSLTSLSLAHCRSSGVSMSEPLSLEGRAWLLSPSTVLVQPSDNPIEILSLDALKNDVWSLRHLRSNKMLRGWPTHLGPVEVATGEGNRFLCATADGTTILAEVGEHITPVWSRHEYLTRSEVVEPFSPVVGSTVTSLLTEFSPLEGRFVEPVMAGEPRPLVLDSADCWCEASRAGHVFCLSASQGVLWSHWEATPFSVTSVTLATADAGLLVQYRGLDGTAAFRLYSPLGQLEQAAAGVLLVRENVLYTVTCDEKFAATVRGAPVSENGLFFVLSTGTRISGYRVLNLDTPTSASWHWDLPAAYYHATPLPAGNDSAPRRRVVKLSGQVMEKVPTYLIQFVLATRSSDGRQVQDLIAINRLTGGVLLSLELPEVMEEDLQVLAEDGALYLTSWNRRKHLTDVFALELHLDRDTTSIVSLLAKSVIQQEDTTSKIYSGFNLSLLTSSNRTYVIDTHVTALGVSHTRGGAATPHALLGTPSGLSATPLRLLSARRPVTEIADVKAMKKLQKHDLEEALPAYAPRAPVTTSLTYHHSFSVKHVKSFACGAGASTSCVVALGSDSKFFLATEVSGRFDALHDSFNATYVIVALAFITLAVIQASSTASRAMQKKKWL
ncbi:MAG: uncharacterized protein KVP18_003057 [Porospora cf. gigantea A]|uniref:uncharacterized protein n=1 Tax=Porospora cf. gigantea A TaxID=2853593 RepID=UPI003559CA66|nr:MAG: hypothetical protein KVP18_003057 [Porospora cf. gigantea A]